MSDKRSKDETTATAEEVAAEERGLEPAEAGAAGEAKAEERDSLRRERDELKDQLLRRRAEFENYKKRVDRDRQQAGFEAAVSIFRELVGTLDNLERALQSGADESTLRAGVELTWRELLSFLESQGVVSHDPVGQPFDPEVHQALVHDFVPGVKEGNVAEVLRKGYSFKDRLLRPALVKVAKGRDDTDETGAGGGIH